MQNALTVRTLIEEYKKWVDRGDIQFLEKGTQVREDVLKLVDSLLKEHLKAERAAKASGEGVSEVLDWHAMHEKGQRLWGKLISCALNDIDGSSKGTSKLLDFLKPATEFEDILYGLEPYYRDHTLHSLWVYLIGEFVLRVLLPGEIRDNLEWYLYESDMSYDNILKEKANSIRRDLHQEVDKHKDAIWCVMALCHDLGYSLEKLDKLNGKVLSVLEFLDLPSFKHVGYSLDVEHQYLVSQFLELMAMDLYIVPSESGDEPLLKCYRDDATYWRVCQALEKGQHGILSSYLIYKSLGVFAKSSVRGAAEEWGLEPDEAKNNMILGNILYGIALHTFDFAYLSHLGSLADILVLADDIEEFSRYGRKMLSRKYHDTTAKTTLRFDQVDSGRKGISINITYEVADHRDLRDFFSVKAERLHSTYSLTPRDTKKSGDNVSEAASYEIDSFELCATQKNNRLAFRFCRDSQHEAEVNGTCFEVTCQDDALWCNRKRLSEFLLEDFKDQKGTFVLRKQGKSSGTIS